MKLATCAALLLFVTCSVAHESNQTRAGAAFQKLKSLAGDWTGTDDHGDAAKTTFQVVVANTAVMETLRPSGMEEMITVYSIDGDGISLVHFCPTNNQPHMRAIPTNGPLTELVFAFQGAGNLPSIAVGHEHKLVMQFDGNDRLRETWTWRKNGKDSLQVYHFTRNKS